MKAKLLIVAISAIALVTTSSITAYGFTLSGRQTRPVAVRQRGELEKVEECFLNKKYRRAADECEKIISSARSHPSRQRNTDEAHYCAGVSYLKLNDLARAEHHLHYVVARGANPRDPVSGDAHIALAQVYLLRNSFDRAKGLLERYLRKCPDGSSLPQAYLMLGQIAQKTGRYSDAERHFAKLKTDYPLSFEATMIPASLGGAAYFSVQVGVFRRLANARKLKRKLEQKGHAPYVIETRQLRSTNYSVRVGSFATKAAAKRLAATLHKQGFETSIQP